MVDRHGGRWAFEQCCYLLESRKVTESGFNVYNKRNLGTPLYLQATENQGKFQCRGRFKSAGLIRLTKACQEDKTHLEMR